MDTIIKNLNLLGKTGERSLMELEEWVNDTANKLNVMLNGPKEESKEEEPDKQISSNDTVIETGTTTKGLAPGSVPGGCVCNYRKWKSGVLELWGKRMCGNVEISTQSVWGGYESVEKGTDNVTYTNIIVWGEWAIPFTDKPTVNYRITGADNDSVAGYYEIMHTPHGRNDTKLVDTRTTSPSFKLWRGTTKTFGHPEVSFYAIGHWK